MVWHVVRGAMATNAAAAAAAAIQHDLNGAEELCIHTLVLAPAQRRLMMN